MEPRGMSMRPSTNVALGLVINNSRGIIFAHSLPRYKESFGDARWQEAVEAATRDMIGELRSQPNAGRLASQ